MTVIFILCASACGGAPAEPSETAEASATPSPTPDPVEGLVAATGQVIAINGLTYTLEIGEMSSGQAAATDLASPEANEAAVEGSLDASVSAAVSTEPQEQASADVGTAAAAETAEPAEEESQPAAEASVSAASAPQAGLHFQPVGRAMEVDMQDAIMRSMSGRLEPDVPVSDIVIGDVITVYLSSSDACAYVTVIARAAEIQGDQGQAEQGTAASEITEDEHLEGQTYEAAGKDENALRISAARVSLSDAQITKSGGDCSDPESGVLFGMNAALLATDAADLILASSRITSVPANAAGICGYGSGTSVSASDSEVETQGSRSSGLNAVGGASIDVQDLTVRTAGADSPALRSGRDSDVTINGGSFSTQGVDSPVVFAAGDAAISAAELAATGSEAVVVENDGSLTLRDSTVSGAMSRTEGTASAESVHDILIYGTEVGSFGNFEMQGGSLISQNGDVFFITNTSCSIELSGVQVTNRDQLAWLFNISGNSGSLGWGTAGFNGAHADIILRSQNTVGDTRVDSVSSMTLHLMEGTSLRGGIRLEVNEAADPDARGTADVIIDEGCVWSLTGDSEVTTLENNGTIEFNGHTITLADGTVLSA